MCSRYRCGFRITDSISLGSLFPRMVWALVIYANERELAECVASRVIIRAKTREIVVLTGEVLADV